MFRLCAPGRCNECSQASLTLAHQKSQNRLARPLCRNVSGSFVIIYIYRERDLARDFAGDFFLENFVLGVFSHKNEETSGDIKSRENPAAQKKSPREIRPAEKVTLKNSNIATTSDSELREPNPQHLYCC